MAFKLFKVVNYKLYLKPHFTAFNRELYLFINSFNDQNYNKFGMYSFFLRHFIKF